VYGIGSDSLSPLGDTSIKAVHAWRDRIIYVATEYGTKSIYVADLVDTTMSNNIN
jgi:hypothetical protein